MENASKALIIAGAILLSILLISLGIMIFTQAQDVVSGSGMTEAQISAFNDKFVKYEGNYKGTMIKSLIQEILATNSGKEQNDGTEVTLKTVASSGPTSPYPSGTTLPATSSIVNNNTYTVSITGHKDDGKVSEITVTGTFK